MISKPLSLLALFTIYLSMMFSIISKRRHKVYLLRNSADREAISNMDLETVYHNKESKPSIKIYPAYFFYYRSTRTFFNVTMKVIYSKKKFVN